MYRQNPKTLNRKSNWEMFNYREAGYTGRNAGVFLHMN